jgi:hypothetical protein
VSDIPPVTGDLWNWRFEAIAEAQRRSRWSVLASVLVSGAILAAEWNSYFSWDRLWANRRAAPSHWGQTKLLEEQIKAWIETNTVDVALLGIRVSVSDAAVLGSVALLIAAFYMCMSLRRENEEVGTLLIDASSLNEVERERVFGRLRSSMLFTGLSKTAAPITSLDRKKRATTRIPFGEIVLKLLTYLPAVTIFVIVASDIYFASMYESPWHQNAQSAWLTLPLQFRVQLVVMDLFAGVAGCVAAVYCRFASGYRAGTQSVIEEFASTLPSSIDDDSR